MGWGGIGVISSGILVTNLLGRQISPATYAKKFIRPGLTVNQNSRRYTCGQGCFLDRGKVFHTPVFGAIHQRCRSFAEITRKIILNIFAATAYEKIVHDDDFSAKNGSFSPNFRLSQAVFEVPEVTSRRHEFHDLESNLPVLNDVTI
jgi:hypothetical protein